jgi:glycosyltransferase involved in cell wall biosynthesis
MNRLNFVFLYTEMADYFYKCVNHLIDHHEVNVLLVNYRTNKDAPFDFINTKPSLNQTYKSDHSYSSLKNLVSGFNPDLIYITGWNDVSYLRIARKYNSRIPVVFGLDNVFTGSIKQRLLVLLNRRILQLFYNNVWIPGTPQYYYARLLGFTDIEITTGLYCADVETFIKCNPLEDSELSRTIVYAGRFVKYKFCRELYEAFNELQNQYNLDWKLVMIGNGPEKEFIQSNEHVTVVDFKQPHELLRYIDKSCVFCLPSISENWGVVLHEFAAAGKLLLVSNRVASASEFVIDNFNGVVFKSGDKTSLKDSLLKVMELDNQDIINYGDNSRRLATGLTHEIWSYKLLSILNRNL